MSRFEPTAEVNVRGLEHSVALLPWSVLRGARGPSDGSAGAGTNVPSALAVLRHAPLYLKFPEEIEEAFAVLESHPMRAGELFPVAVTVVPFLFAAVSRGRAQGWPIVDRIADLIARYTQLAPTLEPKLRDRLEQIVIDHGGEILGWLDTMPRAACAIALALPAFRHDFLDAVDHADEVAPEVLLALVELGATPGSTIRRALDLLDAAASSELERMCAAALLARYVDRTPELRTRINAALPPTAAGALRGFVRELWTPHITRPVVAPRVYDAEVLFGGENLVLVRAGERTVTLPWIGANLSRGDRLKVGLSSHGEPKLALVTTADGGVRVFDF